MAQVDILNLCNDVKKMAHRVCRRVPHSSCFDDVLAAGLLGLVDAAQRFDSSQVGSFKTFAMHRVHGAMLDELRRADPLSRIARSHIRKMKKFRDSVRKVSGVEPALEEVAQEVGVSPSKVRELEVLANISSLSLSSRGQQGDLAESLCSSVSFWNDDDALGVDEQLVRQQTQKLVREGLAALPPRKRQVMESVYLHGMKFSEVAQCMGVTESRVSQLVGESIRQLRRVPAVASCC